MESTKNKSMTRRARYVFRFPYGSRGHAKAIAFQNAVVAAKDGRIESRTQNLGYRFIVSFPSSVSGRMGPYLDYIARDETQLIRNGAVD